MFDSVMTDVTAAIDTFFDSPLGLLTRLVIVILIAVVVAVIARFAITRTVDRIVNGVKKGQASDDTAAITSSPLAAVRVVQRTRTLGTVLTNVVNVVIVIVVLIIIVSNLLPNAASSLALLTAALGAGLGFGAQNVVKDVLNGIFMVMEDQLGVGDVVDVGPATGVVEAVGIRITRVRDVNGVLWFVRNGEIVRVGNMSMGWARVITDLAVPYTADVTTVQERMLATANELASSPKWRSRILEKPELWGIESVSADNVVLRLVMKTRTSARDDVGRELRARLKRTTDEMQLTLPSLASVVLSGFDDATSVTGAKPPRTKPVTVVPEQPAARKSRTRPASAGTPPDRAPDA